MVDRRYQAIARVRDEIFHRRRRTRPGDLVEASTEQDVAISERGGSVGRGLNVVLGTGAKRCTNEAERGDSQGGANRAHEEAAASHPAATEGCKGPVRHGVVPPSRRSRAGSADVPIRSCSSGAVSFGAPSQPVKQRVRGGGGGRCAGAWPAGHGRPDWRTNTSRRDTSSWRRAPRSAPWAPRDRSPDSAPNPGRWGRRASASTRGSWRWRSAPSGGWSTPTCLLF